MKTKIATLTSLWLVASACSHSAPPPAPAAAPAAPGSSVPLFEGLGDHHRKVTTTSADAQKYFDQGLAFLFAFNHDEAIRAFKRASEIDPQCAMAEWGVAIAHGPHINNPMVPPEAARAAWAALQRAQANAAAGTPVEQALIGALAARYADPQPADRRPLDEAYAAAMRTVWSTHPSDADVGALYAEAMMDLRPWDLWTQDGKPQPGTDEIVATLEKVLALDAKHPLANHLYIHAVEASPSPERADAAADTLRDLQPGLGHMVHMPSHIDVRRGRWAQSITANQKAIEADRKYREVVPKQGFYSIYMAHNRHMLAYSAMMIGQSEKALSTIREMAASLPEEWVKENAAFVDGYTGMPMEVLMRFGKWDEILAAPEPAEYLPLARALRRYARGVAYAAKGEVAKAREEEAAFLAAKAAVPKERTFGNNQAADLLAIAENVLAGEILVADKNMDKGIARLRDAVRAEDKIRYNEPPDWIQPSRHALGAALLRAGKKAEAETVFREDLRRLPDNGWALFGLTRALKLQGKKAEATKVEAKFQEVWKDADITLTSSCHCIPGV